MMLRNNDVMLLQSMVIDALQMSTYQELHIGGLRCTPSRVLRSMLKSGKYYPSATWAQIPGQGLHLTKMSAIWKAVVSPR